MSATALRTLPAALAAGLPVPLEWPILLGLLLFAVGLVGVTCRRNILLMLLSVEIMLNAANVVLVAFSRAHHDLAGQVFVFFAMTIAAAEVAVGLAIVIAVYRLRHSTDVDEAQDLGDVDQGPLAPIVLEGEDHHHHDHPGEPGDGHEDEAPHGEVGAATPAAASGGHEGGDHHG